MSLILGPNINQADDMYQVIIDMHQGLYDQESARVNAKMILLLANHIGDIEVVKEAAGIARQESR